jgi:ketosteroid isomerase-like protein
MASRSDTPIDFDPVQAVRDYHAAIAALDFSAVEAFFADDAVYRSAGTGGSIKGRAAILDAFRRYFEEFPDQQAEDSLVERVSPRAARSLWSLVATSRHSGLVSRRSGEETVTFDAKGRIVRVDVDDRETETPGAL